MDDGPVGLSQARCQRKEEEEEYFCRKELAMNELLTSYGRPNSDPT